MLTDAQRQAVAAKLKELMPRLSAGKALSKSLSDLQLPSDLTSEDEAAIWTMYNSIPSEQLQAIAARAAAIGGDSRAIALALAESGYFSVREDVIEQIRQLMSS